MAKLIIKENHPLNETPVHVAFPVLKPFANCFSKNTTVSNDEKEPLLLQAVAQSIGKNDKKIKVKQNKKQNINASEQETNQDPFLLLGSGMIAYRDLLKEFIVLFALISVFMSPAIYYYRYGGYHGYGANVTGN